LVLYYTVILELYFLNTFLIKEILFKEILLRGNLYYWNPFSLILLNVKKVSAFLDTVSLTNIFAIYEIIFLFFANKELMYKIQIFIYFYYFIDVK